MQTQARTSNVWFGPVRRDADTEYFFEAAARHEFPICHCRVCGTYGSPQEKQCPACRSADVEWVAASGVAVLKSWIVVHDRLAPERDPRRLRTVAIGELVEGPWWWAPLDTDEPAALREGQPLQIEFARSGGETLPYFKAL